MDSSWIRMLGRDPVPARPIPAEQFDALRLGALAEQRHTYRDLDADSRFEPTDRDLCDHGHPIGVSFAACSECIGFQYSGHTPDWQETGEIRLCRRCGLSSGTHAAGLL